MLKVLVVFLFIAHCTLGVWEPLDPFLHCRKMLYCCIWLNFVPVWLLVRDSVVVFLLSAAEKFE